MLDLPPLSTEDPLLTQSMASLAPVPLSLEAEQMSIDTPSVAIPEDSSPPTSTPVATGTIDSGDTAAQAAMFGRYTGQIDARIERAWRRPRTAIATGRSFPSSSARSPSPEIFDCQVRILQDTEGRVQEVDLLRCNGTVAWQQSLVTAILTSSPLPAPPAPNVFTSSLVMRFRALPYAPDRSADDYELPSTAVASND